MIISILILMGRMKVKYWITRSTTPQRHGREHDQTCNALGTARAESNKAEDMTLCAHASTN